jgi:hypothetical protein
MACIIDLDRDSVRETEAIHVQRRQERLHIELVSLNKMS